VRLRARFHGQRQSSIDEELFDVTAGYVALQASGTQEHRARGSGPDPASIAAGLVPAPG
jgi:hypothetical protein